MRFYILAGIFLVLAALIVFGEAIVAEMYSKNNKLSHYCQECMNKDFKKMSHFADKHFAKEYFTENPVRDLNVPETFFRAKNPDDVKNFELKEKCVMKHTYGSNKRKSPRVFILDGKNSEEVDIYEEARRMMSDTGDFKNQKQYDISISSVIFEKFIDIVGEIKAMTLHGDIISYTVIIDSVKRFMSKDRKIIPTSDNFQKIKGFFKKENFEMFELTNQIDVIENSVKQFYRDTKFDFFRFDTLVDREGKVYFGEITFTPSECKFKLPSMGDYNKYYKKYVQLK